MHVLYFHQYFTTPKDAGGTRSYEMAKKLISRGHSVTMVCARSGEEWLNLPGNRHDPVREGTIDGIKIIQFNMRYSNYLNAFQRVRIFLRFAFRSVVIAMKYDYDLLFATSTPLSIAIPGIMAHLFRRKPFIFEVRDLWPELLWAIGAVKNIFLYMLLSFLEWMSYHSARACIALSPGIQKGILRRAPRNCPVSMIPNGCDLKLFKPGKREDLDLPGILPKACVAVFTGAHGISNGLDAVLDTAKVLLSRGRQDIVLAFIGDGKLKPSLVRRAEEEGLVNCRFFDPIPKNKIAQIVSSCDIGLMILADVPAFYYGTSPNKFFDYISSGLPVINNYPGWLSDLINEHRCGITVPPNNPEAFADALCRLADNQELRLEYGQNSRCLAVKYFSRDQLGDNFVDWIEKNINI